MMRVALYPLLAGLPVLAAFSSSCRTQPGDSKYPSDRVWSALNFTVGGALVKVVPFAAHCKTLPGGQCTAEQYTSAKFRSEVPGSMHQVNWEQDYDASPPSLCYQASTDCGQGNVPLYAIVAGSVRDVQSGLLFALLNNIRLSIKSSGHDFLGRSTAKNSLLISTHKFQDITFADDFAIRGTRNGSAVTVGAGVGLAKLYQAAKAKGKVIVGGTAAGVAAAGGYVQGGGHSALSPTFGMAVDNVLEFKVVLADGRYVNVNAFENSDLFWAMRGGGPGSWGVVISATFRTYPTFDSVRSSIVFTAPSVNITGDIAKVNAERMFDLDKYRAGQYYYTTATASPGVYRVIATTHLPRLSVAEVITVMAPFIAAAQRVGGVLVSNTTALLNINDALTLGDDVAGATAYLGSRLIPESLYRDSPEAIGQLYRGVLNEGATNILGHHVASGKVSDNANLDMALNPAWRTAKSHLIVVNYFSEASTLATVQASRVRFKQRQLPLFEQAAGTKQLGAYVNEADTLEDNFREVFYGGNYAKLTRVKAKYDPTDLFLVTAGVGSERWDKNGLCKV